MFLLNLSSTITKARFMGSIGYAEIYEDSAYPIKDEVELKWLNLLDHEHHMIEHEEATTVCY